MFTGASAANSPRSFRPHRNLVGPRTRKTRRRACPRGEATRAREGEVLIIAIDAAQIGVLGVAEERGERWSTRSPRSTPTRPPTPPPRPADGHVGADGMGRQVVGQAAERWCAIDSNARALGYYVPEKLHAARWVRCLPSADVPRPLEVVKSPVGWWVTSTCKWASHTPLTSK